MMMCFYDSRINVENVLGTPYAQQQEHLMVSTHRCRNRIVEGEVSLSSASCFVDCTSATYRADVFPHEIVSEYIHPHTF